MGMSNHRHPSPESRPGTLPFQARLLRLLYRNLFGFGYYLYLPRYIVRLRRRGPWRKGFMHRLGFVPESAGNRKQPDHHLVWLHAVSVGEVMAASAFIDRWRNRRSNIQFLLSTTTNTGRQVAEQRVSEDVAVVYFPADAPRFVRRALTRVAPDMLCLFESELWPTWIEECHRVGIPVCTVNGRMSSSAWKGYMKNRVLFSWVLNQLSLAIGQGEDYADRMRALGVAPEKIKLAGSMKFDSAQVPDREGREFGESCLRAAGFQDCTVLVAASTHDGEERMLVQLVQRLQKEKQYRDLRLVLVPRHIERVPGLLEQLLEEKQTWVLRSGLDLKKTVPAEHRMDQRRGPGYPPVLVVDTTGELGRLTAVADVVVIGKSFLAHGGQNPLEGAAAGRAVVTGPNMENFSDIVAFLRERNALVQVDNTTELERELRRLLGDAAAREALGRRARAAVRAGCGAMDRTIDWLEKLFENPARN
jgi:3-deoxy-D-manno-octulosonic-acid transferase